MIEVLKHGDKREVECPKCGALLSYRKDDIEERFSNIPLMVTMHEKFIICPDCNNKIVLESTR